MQELSVWIRAFNGRLYQAEALKERCITHLSPNTSVINTGKAGCTYSEKFVLGLHNALLSCNTPYILILEDDMEFSKDALREIRHVMSDEYPMMWYSIPSADAIRASAKVSGSVYMLRNFNRFPYSGAILIQKSVLMHFVADYLINYLNFEFREFDICLSLYFKNTFRCIFIQPNIFRTTPSTISSFACKNIKIAGRIDIFHEIDPVVPNGVGFNV